MMLTKLFPWSGRGECQITVGSREKGEGSIRDGKYEQGF